MKITLKQALIKDQKRILLIEALLLLFIFIVAFSSFIFYVDSYRQDWNALFYDDPPSDLQITISEPFSIFSVTSPQIKESLENSFSLFLLPPSDFFITSINGSEISNILYIACSLDIFELINSSSPSPHNLFFITSDSSVNETMISTEFLPVATNNTLNITTVFSPTLLKSHLNSYSSLFEDFLSFSDDSYSLYNPLNDEKIMLLSTPHLLTLLTSGDREMINEITEEIPIISIYHTKWNEKLTYINSIPQTVIKAHNNWVGQLLDSIYSIYYPDYIFLSSVSMSSSLLFKESFMLISEQYFNSLLSSILIFFSISSFLLVVFYFYLKQQNLSLKGSIQFLITKGARKSEIFKVIFQVHLSILFFTFLLSITVTFIFAFILDFYSWLYFYLMLLISNSIIIIMSLIFEFIILNHLQNIVTGSISNNSNKKVHYSFFKNTIQTITFFLCFVSFVLMALFFLFEFQSNKTIFVLSLLFLSLITVVFTMKYIPELIRKYTHPLFQKIFRRKNRENKFILRTLNLSYFEYKHMWSILFMILFLFSFFLASYKEFNTYGEQKEQSSKLKDFTIKVRAKDINVLKAEFSENDHITIYYTINYAYNNHYSMFYLFLLDSPLSFFSSTKFYHNYFNQYSNDEIFTLMNSSSTLVISDRTTREELFLNHLEKFSLKYANYSSITSIDDEMIFLDDFLYLPFLTNFAEELPLVVSKYSKESVFENIIDEEFGAIFSISIDEQLNKSSILNKLKNLNIIFSVYDDTDSSLTKKDGDLLATIANLTYPFYFIMFFIPLISITFLVYLYLKIREYFVYLEIRGLKQSLSQRSISGYIVSILCLNLAFCALLALIFELIFWGILRSVIIMPYYPIKGIYITLFFVMLTLSTLTYGFFAEQEKTFTNKT